MHAFLALLLLAQTPSVPTLNGTITGVVRVGGKPIAGIRVAAVVPPGGGELMPSAMLSLGETDSEGRYRLEGVPPGRYYISAGRVDLPTYYPGSTTLSEGSVITVAPGAALTGMDFGLRNESLGRVVSAGTFLGVMTAAGFSIPVNLQVEGGGKIPVFQNGTYPVIRATKVSGSAPIEIPFSEPMLVLPIPPGTSTDEYRISVHDLQEYTVKAITFGSTDLQKGSLKIPIPGSNIPISFVTGQTGVVLGPQTIFAAPSPVAITVVLSSLLAAPAAPSGNGVRVTGRSVGSGDEIYLSGSPGTLYSDGTFEFRNVPPGLHKIMKTYKTAVTAAAVLVGDRDVDGVVLQRPQLLPADVFDEPPKPSNGSPPESKTLSLVSITGRVLDPSSQEPLSEGAVTLAGYGTARRIFAIVGTEFKIPDLLPGRYSLTINVSGYVTATQSVIVGTEDFKLDLIARKEE